MFKENKYTKWYFDIINNAIQRKQYYGYTETHHIIPKCLDGENEMHNIVVLTAKEHFLCHLLLTKMNNSYKLKYALVAMSLENDKQTRYKMSARMYEIVKKQNSLAASERMMGHDGHNTGRIMYHSSISGKRKFFKDGDIITDEWIKGMSPNSKTKIGGKNKSKIYYNNGQNVIALNPDDLPPEGWIKGNPKADTSEYNNIRGSKYYYNVITGKEIRSQTHPGVEWMLGRSVIWITDGFTNKQINKIMADIPENWNIGRSKFK